MSIQHDVLDAIIDMAPDEPDPIGTIAARTGLERHRVSAVAYNLVRAQRITRITSGRWQATDEGRTWLAAYRSRANDRARANTARQARAAHHQPNPTGTPIRLDQEVKKPRRQLASEGWL